MHGTALKKRAYRFSSARGTCSRRSKATTIAVFAAPWPTAVLVTYARSKKHSCTTRIGSRRNWKGILSYGKKLNSHWNWANKPSSFFRIKNTAVNERMVVFMKHWIRKIGIQLEYYLRCAIAIVTAPYWVPMVLIAYKKTFGGIFNYASAITWNRLTKEEQDQWVTETMRKIINFEWV